VKAAKKRNATDLTLRNLRALKRRMDETDRVIRVLAHAVGIKRFVDAMNSIGDPATQIRRAAVKRKT
jgi:intracellular sulfur oxidation DsrE/DsrF family protein